MGMPAQTQMVHQPETGTADVAMQIWNDVFSVLRDTFGNTGTAIVIVVFAVYLVWMKCRKKWAKK